MQFSVVRGITWRGQSLCLGWYISFGLAAEREKRGRWFWRDGRFVLLVPVLVEMIWRRGHF